MNQKLNNFCRKYECRIKDTGQYQARINRHMFNDPYIDIKYSEMNKEKVYSIEISESRLETLLEMEDTFFNMHHPHGRALYDILLEKEREEKTLRKQSPAVQKAYEQYMIMLGLAGYSPKI